MSFNEKKLTGAELLKVEELSGGNMESIKGTYAVYYVWTKRSNPELSWEEALEATVEEVFDALGVSDSVNLPSVQ